MGRWKEECNGSKVNEPRRSAWGSGEPGVPGCLVLSLALPPERRQARPDKSDRQIHRTRGAAGIARPAGTVSSGQAIAAPAVEHGVGNCRG